jgi:hypothetical protein
VLRVQIKINATQIIDVYAQRMERFKGHDFVHNYEGYVICQEQKVFLGDIRHRYSSGPEELAVKVLRLHKKWEMD